VALSVGVMTWYVIPNMLSFIQERFSFILLHWHFLKESPQTHGIMFRCAHLFPTSNPSHKAIKINTRGIIMQSGEQNISPNPKKPYNIGRESIGVCIKKIIRINIIRFVYINTSIILRNWIYG